MVNLELPPLPPPPPPRTLILFTQEPLMPSALPTGDTFPVPGGGQRPQRIPGVWGALGGAILGDVAATSKMAGLAYEDWTGSASLPELYRKLLGPDSPCQTAATLTNSDLCNKSFMLVLQKQNM